MALTPPREHADRRWHWIETEYGIMPASWFPLIGDQGSWEISGHVFEAAEPRVLREWRYVAPAVPPETES
jgi:hypothetical protein